MTRGSEFGVFANAPCVRYLVVPRAFSRAELGAARGAREGVGGEGARVPRRRGGEIRSPIAKFLSERSSRRSRAEPGSTVLFVADERGDRRARARRPPRCTSAASSTSIDRARDVFHWVHRLPALRARRGDGRLDVHAPSVHRADRRARRSGIEADPGERARPALRPDLERLGARLRLDPDPRRRACRRRSSATMGLTRRGGAGEVRLPARRARRWARRRTAASRWASSASSR